MKPHNTYRHPLDSLFKTGLLIMSMSKFEKAKAKAKLASVPRPWRWTQTPGGSEWTLMGRKAHLLWNASPAHYVKNHSLGLYALREAFVNGEIWHESDPGKPDILVFWLGTMRYGGMPHRETQNMISRALMDTPAGAGKPGDGGFIDRTIALVEREIASGQTTPERRSILMRYAISPWLMGTILRVNLPGAADWRPVSEQSLPVVWPTETIERLWKLGHSSSTGSESPSFLDGVVSATALVGQLAKQVISPSLMKWMEEILLYESNTMAALSATGAMFGLDHYLSRGLVVRRDVLEQLKPHLTAPPFDQLPYLYTAIQRHALEYGSHAAPIKTRNIRL